MSLEMDTLDVRGWLRGLCLIAMVRSSDGRLDHARIGHHLDVALDGQQKPFVCALASYTGIEERVLQEAVDELLAADVEYVLPDNLNLQLSLLAGQPMPPFGFVQEAGVDRVALLHPLLEAAFKLTHAAIRARMQAPAGAKFTSIEELSGALGRFLGGVWGEDEIGGAFAVATIARAAGDVLFFNGDSASRASEPELAGRIEAVLGELRATAMFAATSSVYAARLGPS